MVLLDEVRELGRVIEMIQYKEVDRLVKRDQFHQIS